MLIEAVRGEDGEIEGSVLEDCVYACLPSPGPGGNNYLDRSRNVVRVVQTGIRGSRLKASVPTCGQNRNVVPETRDHRS